MNEHQVLRIEDAVQLLRVSRATLDRWRRTDPEFPNPNEHSEITTMDVCNWSQKMVIGQTIPSTRPTVSNCCGCLTISNP